MKILKEFIRILSFKELTPINWVFIFLIFFMIHIPAINNCKDNDNVYISLARSFVKGNLTIDERDLPYIPGTHARNTGDMIFYHGKYYLPYPPAPAILLLPFVLVFEKINSLLICVLLSCLNMFVMYSLFRKLKIQDTFIPWLIYGFMFGTGYWFVLLTSHHVYGFAEVVSVTGILLFLNELLGKKRSLLLGLFLSIAFLSRQFTIVLCLFAIGYLLHYYLISPKEQNKKLFWRKTILFLCSFGCSVLIYCLYNYARFGNPIDSGYRYIAFLGVLEERVDHYGVFSIHYVLYNLYNYLLKGFNITFTGNGLLHIHGMDLFGSALLIASPFLVSAFKSGWQPCLRIFAWVTIGIIFTGLLFYHNNGEEQVNTSRFTLDFLPLMYLMTASGADKIPAWLFKSMVIYAIVVNMIAFAIHLKYHTWQ